MLGSNIKFENQLADLETLFTICKVQFNKDRYKIVPVIQSNPKCKMLNEVVRQHYCKKISRGCSKLLNVECVANPTAAVMSFWNLK